MADLDPAPDGPEQPTPSPGATPGEEVPREGADGTSGSAGGAVGGDHPPLPGGEETRTPFPDGGGARFGPTHFLASAHVYVTLCGRGRRDVKCWARIPSLVDCPPCLAQLAEYQRLGWVPMLDSKLADMKDERDEARAERDAARRGLRTDLGPAEAQTAAAAHRNAAELDSLRRALVHLLGPGEDAELVERVRVAYEGHGAAKFRAENGLGSTEVDALRHALDDVNDAARCWLEGLHTSTRSALSEHDVAALLALGAR